MKKRRSAELRVDTRKEWFLKGGSLAGEACVLQQSWDSTKKSCLRYCSALSAPQKIVEASSRC